MTTYRHLFGPVPSRRFGRSFGVDLTPLKTCSFNCVFCQLGPTPVTSLERREYVPVPSVKDEILHWRDTGGTADYATLSGSGEPTLHSGFGEVLRFLKAELPCPAVLLTNGSLLHLPEVRAAAAQADIVKLSLSAWDDDSFRRVNRPHPDLDFLRSVDGMRQFRQAFSGRLWLEVFLIADLNDAPDQVERIAAWAAAIGPDKIHLNTAVRPPAESTVRPVDKERLESLAKLFLPRAEVIAGFTAQPGSGTAVNETAILDMLRRRPCTAQQLADVFGMHLNEVAKYTGHLLRTGRIQSLQQRDQIYYEASRARPSGRISNGDSNCMSTNKRPHQHSSHPKPAAPLTPYGNRPMVTPIVHAVNYEYLNFEVLRQITDGEVDGYTYHRDDNPTVRAVERQIAALEGADDCVVCTSGMAACTMVYLTYLRAGGHLILFHDIYGAHYKVSLILERLGVEVTWVDAADWRDLPRHFKPNTQMVFLETPSNPLCKTVDVAAVRKMADKVGAMVVVDNTFATPYHQHPLSLGAHLVVHSATKALGGHNDLMAGAIAGSKDDYDKLWFTRQAIGCTLDAYSASLLERGLKTFPLRAERMAENAMAVARHLAKCPRVSHLRYPGLKADDGHRISARQMRNGFGGMMAFDVGRTQDDAKRFISALKTIRHAVSLGSTESLICIPFLTTMLYMPPERRTAFGVRPNSVRLSVGVEPIGDLLADLDQALGKSPKTKHK